MTEQTSQCSCVVDTSGLHAIATASGNVRSLLLDKLKQGVIGVPACAWHEFSELYEHEVIIIAPHLTKKLIMNRATYVGAARIAEKLNSGFSRGAYDDHTELYVASIASNNTYRVLTTADQVPHYVAMECDVSDLETWVAELGE